MPDRDLRPHSRACGPRPHPHGTACHRNCPTCHQGPAPCLIAPCCSACGREIDRDADGWFHVQDDPERSIHNSLPKEPNDAD